MYRKKKELSKTEFYQKMFDITTSRIMELQPMKNALDKGHKITIPTYIFNNTWAINQYWHKYSYMMLKGLQ